MASDSLSLGLEKLIQLLVVFTLIFLPAMAFLSQFGSSDYFERNFLALDVSLLTDTVLASPNDLVYGYKNPTKEFAVEISDSQVKAASQYTGAASYYINNPSLRVVYRTIFPLEEVEDDEARLSPILLMILKQDNQVKFYDAKSIVLAEQDEPEEQEETQEVQEEEITFNMLYRDESGYHFEAYDAEQEGIIAYVLSMPADPDHIITTAQEHFGQKTTEWFTSREDDGVDVAINANFFYTPTRPRFMAGNNGDLFNERGLYTRDRSVGALIVYKDGTMELKHLNEDMPDVDTIDRVVSGTPMILNHCEEVLVHDFMNAESRPRTWIAVEEDTLHFIIFRSATQIIGMDRLQYTDICQCEDKDCSLLNLDGGGSTTLVYKGELIFEGEPGQRTVANHLGYT